MKRARDKSGTAVMIVTSLFWNGVAPYWVYIWLKPQMGSLNALLLATCIPLAENVYTFVRHRKLDAFGVMMTAVFLLSALLVALGGTEKIVLIRESAVTVMVGCWFLLSLLAKRPLMYHLALRFTVEPDPESQAAFASRWQNSHARKMLRLLTIGWGLGLLVEAAVRTVLVLQLPTERFLLWSPFVFYGALGILILWTAICRSQSRRYLGPIDSGANRQ